MFGLFIFFLFFDDLYGALGGVGKNVLELILGDNHFACLGVIPVERNRIKLTLRRAKSAADAAVLIDDRCAAAETS